MAKILNLVENAGHKKPPTENFITKFARYYTPAVVAVALVLAVIPPLIIPGALFSDWLYRALVFFWWYHVLVRWLFLFLWAFSAVLVVLPKMGYW